MDEKDKNDENYKEKWINERVSKRNHSMIMIVIVGLGMILKEAKNLGTSLTIILIAFLIAVILIIFKIYTP